MKMKKVTMWVFGVLRISEWRLVPWYESATCDSGCCTGRRFTWLFFRVEWITRSSVVVEQEG